MLIEASHSVQMGYFMVVHVLSNKFSFQVNVDVEC